MIVRPALLFVAAAGLLQTPASVAPIETCGTDRVLAQPHALSREALILAADRRLFSPCETGTHGDDHLERRDLALLDQALASNNADFRRIAVQGLGRMVAPSLVDRILPLVDDAAPPVRMAAVHGVAQALSGLRSDLRPEEAPAPAAIRAARERLQARFDKETDDEVAGVILASVGRMRHAEADLQMVEAWLTDNAAGAPDRLVGAAMGLEAFARRNPRRPLAEPARQRLRDIASLGRTATGERGEMLARLRRMAMTALQVARDTDITTQLEATVDPDWQVRRIAVQMMNAAIQQVRPAVLALLKDPQMHVRIEAIRSFARGLQTINDCAPIVTMVGDTAPLVAMQAMDSLTTGCRDLPGIVAAVAAEADKLPGASATTWHRPARALTTLARLAPDDARKRLGAAQSHAVWQVRATAATAAGVLNDAPVAVALAKDATANVRTAAIDALARMKSPDVAGAAIAALPDRDHQVVRAAARALQGSTNPAAADALFAALRRLTAGGSDTSRDPRVAIVDRLAELLGAARVGELAEWTADWDTAVRAAAIRAFTAAKVEVPTRPRQYRYPLQPSLEELRTALQTKTATIEMASGGTLTLTLLADEAPMTLARFVTLARAGRYDGLTFHRVVPNFVVQGLSPGANEYVGDDRFMRDEVGLQSHVRGAVGISTRGYDTGDAQIFFDLVDVPRLDHEYTVFARITAGIEHLDAMLEGAEVKRVTVR